jgi:hypothetical protein
MLHWIETLPWWAPGALTECVFVGFVVMLYPFSLFKWAQHVGDAIMWVSWGAFFVFYGIWFVRYNSVVTVSAAALVPVIGTIAFILLVRRSMKHSPKPMRTSILGGGKVLRFPGAQNRRSVR